MPVGTEPLDLYANGTWYERDGDQLFPEEQLNVNKTDAIFHNTDWYERHGGKHGTPNPNAGGPPWDAGAPWDNGIFWST